MMMPGRKFADNSAYRYGFNGKENDNDVKGVEGSQQDYGFRIYDPRIGKFLSVDPISIDYPELTAYQFASNRPIEGVDLDGLELGLARLLYSRNTSTKVNKTEERKVITMSSTKSNSCHGVGNPNFVMSTYLPKGEPWFKKFNKLVGIGEGNNEGIRNGGGSRITSEDALGQNGPKATNPDPEAIKLDMLVISRLGQLESNPGLAPKDMLDWMIIAKDFTENQMGAKKAGPGATQYLADEVIPVVQEFFSKEQNSETPKYCTDCQITYIISGNDTTGVLPKTAESEKIKGKVDTIDVKSEQHPKVLKFKTSE